MGIPRPVHESPLSVGCSWSATECDTGLLMDACSCKMGDSSDGQLQWRLFINLADTLLKPWGDLGLSIQPPLLLPSHPSQLPPTSFSSLPVPLIGISLDKLLACLILSWHLLLEGPKLTQEFGNETRDAHSPQNRRVSRLADVRAPKYTDPGLMPVKPNREGERFEKGTPRHSIVFLKPAN